MSQLEADTIAKSCAVSKTLLLDLLPKLQGLQAIYDSEGGVKTTLTQAEMDENPALSGLTKVQLDDALFAMTGAILTGIENAYPAIAQIAARFV